MDREQSEKGRGMVDCETPEGDRRRPSTQVGEVAFNKGYGSFINRGTVGRSARKANRFGRSWEEALNAGKVYGSVSSVFFFAMKEEMRAFAEKGARGGGAGCLRRW